MIDRPGIYDIQAEEYHADCCAAPSLSSSIARLLVAESPLHAWHAHARLNPAFTRTESQQLDLGSAAHTYLLEGATPFRVVVADNWKTKAAQGARALARLEGKIPLLDRQWKALQEMTAAARTQLARHPAPIPLEQGKPERTLIWLEQDVWCRARLDWLHDNERVIDDYKSTATSANPETWTRLLFGSGYDIQAAFYLRGLRAVTGRDALDASFRFVVQEVSMPYAVSVIGLDPQALALAEKKVEWAIALWSECLNTNRWPGYPRQTCYATVPGWHEAQWLERKYRDELPPARQPDLIEDDGRPIEDLLFGDNEA